jgi:GNAT superfamily N-acetyltransferase/predicted nucleic acid-binding protein
MSAFKFLIDTNVFIGLEDPKEIDGNFAELIRKCSEHGVRVFVHEASVQELTHDRDQERQAVALSKARKFEQLSGMPLPAKNFLETELGVISRPNDQVDVTLLHALKVNAVDFLITQDHGIFSRVRLGELQKRVLTVNDALSWLRQTFEPQTVRLPFVAEQKAYEIDLQDDIFDSLREGYPNFDRWWRERCVAEHRACWTIRVDDELAGLVVRKDENHSAAGTFYDADKILKISTFKVKPKYRGEKFGELLLKQILWFAQRNNYGLAYLTTYPEQNILIGIIEYYGFEKTHTRSDGELVYEKKISRTRLNADPPQNPFVADRINYPRFVARGPVKAFCVPIRGPYHQKLFPEIAFLHPLPLFPDNDRYVVSTRHAKVPGNTIRKVYLCRAKTTEIASGDILIFYQSKSPGFRASQSITTVGIVEDVSWTKDYDELVQLTAKRSVFSEIELKGMIDRSDDPVMVIDFLLIGHLDPPIPLPDLLSARVFSGKPPQSICLVTPDRFDFVRKRMNFGFEL